MQVWTYLATFPPFPHGGTCLCYKHIVFANAWGDGDDVPRIIYLPVLILSKVCPRKGIHLLRLLRLLRYKRVHYIWKWSRP